MDVGGQLQGEHAADSDRHRLKDSGGMGNYVRWKGIRRNDDRDSGRRRFVR